MLTYPYTYTYNATTLSLSLWPLVYTSVLILKVLLSKLPA